MDHSVIKDLLEKYKRQELPEQQVEILMAALSDAGYDDLLLEDILKELEQPGVGEGMSHLEQQQVFRQIKQVTGMQSAPVIRQWWKYAAAAVILLGIGLYWLLPAKKMADKPLVADIIPPGNNKAILTTGTGSRIVLGTGQTIIPAQGNIIAKQVNGRQLTYSGIPTATVLNTLTTPLGGQFQLVLADGTRVWLNAGSAITYPTAFTGKERSVTLKGEAYFEVAAKATQPFKVLVNGMEVHVLGTHFNIMAYEDEPNINTTLLEGSVKVIHENSGNLLKPGMQASLSKTGFILSEADTTAVIAWKNGTLFTKDADIPTIMRQISRWYNVTVSYEGGIPGRRFTLDISRDISLDDLLVVLEANGVHCKLEGRNVIVSNK